MKRPWFLSLVLLSAPPLPSAGPQSAETEPLGGLWTGDDQGVEVEFTVSPDGRVILDLQMSWIDFSKYRGHPTCIVSQQAGSGPVGSGGRFEFSDSTTGPMDRKAALIQGEFTSDTTVTGAWVTGFDDCRDAGHWSASRSSNASMNCSEFGTFKLCAWVRDAKLDDRSWDASTTRSVTVYGQLLNEGVGVEATALTMRVSSSSRQGKYCDYFPDWGIGKCDLEKTEAEPGEAISIEVTIERNGPTYSTRTSFKGG